MLESEEETSDWTEGSTDASFDQLTDFEASSSETTDEARSAGKKLRGEGRTWEKVKEFDCANAAKEFIKTDKVWAIRHTFDTLDGTKVVYRCNKVPRSGPQCPAAMYLLHHAEKESVSAFRTLDDHNHHRGNEFLKRGLRLECSEAVKELYKDGVKKPQDIMSALGKRQIPLPRIQQLNNFLQYYRRKEEGGSKMNVGEFEDWCSNRSEPSTDDLNKPFVVSHAGGLDEEGKVNIRLFISTPRLLQLATKSRILHADGTYTLNWEGLPVIVVGSTDQNRRFHPIGLGLTSRETADDYAFVFAAIVSGVQDITGVDYQPDTLIADAADAISNGFAAVFGVHFRRVTCWFHVSKAIKDRLKKISSAERRQQLNEDIRELQLCESERIFDVVSELFFTKWRGANDREIDNFLHYFRSEWISAHKGWFEGFANNVPSTNNALESMNARIKQHGTLRNRLPLPRFLGLAEQSIIRSWSYDRDPANPSCKVFARIPTKETALWTKSYQWASSSSHVLGKSRGDGWRDYYVTASGQTEISPAVINQYRAAFDNLNWPSFDNYAAMRSGLWKVSIYEHSWEAATCNCPAFLEEYICKHSLGVAIRKQYCQAPEVAKSVPIGRKRKRGRPRLATAALSRD